MLSRAKSKARTIECLSQKKQLGLAWHLYSDDNQGRLVPNSGSKLQGGTGGNGPTWIAGRMDWRTFPTVTNIFSYISDLEATEGQYLLFPYVNNEKMFRCPEDRYLSPPQRAAGWAHRGRSISMNMYMGAGVDKDWWQLTVGMEPLWEISTQQGLTVYSRYDQMIKLAPCRAWVITDEHADSIRDATFEPRGDSVPANYHNGAATFLFADGHTETRRWTDPGFKRRVQSKDFLTPPLWESADAHWVMNGMTEISDGFSPRPWYPSQ